MASSVALPTGGLDNVSDDWDAQTIGLYLAMLMVGDGATARGGVVPGAGNPLKVTAVSGQMKVSVAPGRAAVAVPNSLRGVQPFYLGTTTQLDVPTADGIQDRRDLIIAEVGDFGTSGSFREIRVVPGRIDVAGAPLPTTNWVTAPTGGGTPVGRDLGNGGWMEIGSTFVGHGQTSVTAYDLRKMLMSPGGAPAIPGASDPLTSSIAWTPWLPPSSLVVDPDVDELRIFDPTRGMVNVIASGTKLDYGVFRNSSQTVNPGATINQGALTYAAAESVNPTSSVNGSNSNIIDLAPASVYDVSCDFYLPGGLAGIECELAQAVSGNAVLAGAVSVGTYPRVSLASVVYSSVYPQITTTLHNTAGIGKSGIVTTIRVSRRQTGRTGV